MFMLNQQFSLRRIEVPGGANAFFNRAALLVRRGKNNCF